MNKDGTVNVDIKFTIEMKPNVFQWHNNTNNALATMEMPIKMKHINHWKHNTNKIWFTLRSICV